MFVINRDWQISPKNKLTITLHMFYNQQNYSQLIFEFKNLVSSYYLLVCVFKYMKHMKKIQCHVKVLDTFKFLFFTLYIKLTNKK